MKALVLVAHPDDELLFAGEVIAQRPEWEWNFVALTGGEREAQFPGLSLGFPDVWNVLSVQEFANWRNDVAGLELRPDVVFTHNRMGEYGHPHHMAVHRIAHELFTVPIWDFLYEGPSSVGRQEEGAVVWDLLVSTDKAQAIIGRYGADTMASLIGHQPEMIARLLTRETFTRAWWPLP